jgi:hypothetical protein
MNQFILQQDVQLETKGFAVLNGLLNIQKKLAITGIPKDRRTKSTNQRFQNFNFRSIDDFYNAISPLLAEESIICMPDVLEQTQTTIQTPNGSTQRFSFVRVKYTFISCIDGSYKSGVCVGEAMDSADKSLSKAMSIAQKTFFEQAFSIPTTPQENNRFFMGSEIVQINNHQLSENNTISSSSTFPTQEEFDQFIKLLGAIGRSYQAYLTKRQLRHEQITRDILRVETSKIEKYINNQNSSNCVAVYQ